jgi:hypothetical protein
MVTGERWSAVSLEGEPDREGDAAAGDEDAQRPPIRKPAASGATKAQRTGPNRAKPAAATALASPEMRFFTALVLAIDSARMGVRTASSRMPPAAPKYPT